MKLPEITYNIRVQNLAKKSPFLPVARAGTRAAGARMAGTAAAATGAIARNIYDRQIKMEVEKFQEDWALIESQIDDEMDEQKEFRRIDDDYGRERTVPGWVGRPDAKREAKQQALDDLLPSISDTEMAGTVRAETMERINKGYGRDLLIANLEQKQARRAQQINTIELFKQRGNYPAAREIAKNLEDPVERQANLFKIDKQEETDPIYQAMAANDVPEMERYLKILQNPEYEGTLLNKEREQLTGYLEAEIWKAGKAARDAKVASDKRLKWDGRRVRDALYGGYEVPLKRVENVVLALVGVDDELAQEIGEAVQFQRYAAQLSRKSPMQQWAEVEQARKLAGESEGAALFHQRLESVVNRNIAAMNKDAMAHAVTTGQIAHVPLDPQNLAASLNAKMKNEQIVFDNNGITTGILTNQEAVTMANIFSQTPTAQLPALYAEIERGMGDQSFKLYEQLKEAGLVGVAAIAGQTYAEGGYAEADILIQGAQLRKRFPKALSKIDNELTEMISNQIRFVFNDKPNEAKWRTAAVKDAYLFFIAQDADADAMPLGVDPDVFQAAIAIGAPTSEINGRKIQPAYLGQPENQMQEYVDNISVPTLHLMGKPLGFSYRQLQQDLQNDNIEVISRGKNRYYLYHPATNAYVRDERTGGLFNFSYIDNPYDREPEPEGTVNVPGIFPDQIPVPEKDISGESPAVRRSRRIQERLAPKF